MRKLMKSSTVSQAVTLLALVQTGRFHPEWARSNWLFIQFLTLWAAKWRGQIQIYEMDMSNIGACQTSWNFRPMPRMSRGWFWLTPEISDCPLLPLFLNWKASSCSFKGKVNLTPRYICYGFIFGKEVNFFFLFCVKSENSTRNLKWRKVFSN